MDLKKVEVLLAEKLEIPAHPYTSSVAHAMIAAGALMQKGYDFAFFGQSFERAKGELYPYLCVFSVGEEEKHFAQGANLATAISLAALRASGEDIKELGYDAD